LTDRVDLLLQHALGFAQLAVRRLGLGQRAGEFLGALRNLPLELLGGRLQGEVRVVERQRVLLEQALGLLPGSTLAREAALQTLDLLAHERVRMKCSQR
jgi:hypothetical protein